METGVRIQHIYTNFKVQLVQLSELPSASPSYSVEYQNILESYSSIISLDDPRCILQFQEDPPSPPPRTHHDEGRRSTTWRPSRCRCRRASSFGFGLPGHLDGEWMVIGWWLERNGRKDPEPETKKN